MTSTSPPATSLAAILDLEDAGPDAWRAWSPARSSWAHIFGGQVAAQALRAAGLTVEPDRTPNSVHGYFLRRGQVTLPLDIHVERLREGRTYTSRHVDVRQEGKTIFAMLASFHVEEPGREWDHVMPRGVPGPETVAPDPGGDWLPAIEVRTLEVEGPRVRWWGQVREPLPADPLLHFCAILYASDLRAGGAVMRAVGFNHNPRSTPDTEMEPHRPPFVDGDGHRIGRFGSLDHALWFHRIPDAGEWVFCDVRPIAVRDSRGLVVGEMFDQQGQHLATFTQEVFLKAE